MSTNGRRRRRNSSYTPFSQRSQSKKIFEEYLPEEITHDHQKHFKGFCEKCLNNQLRRVLVDIRLPDEEWNQRIQICQQLEQLLKENYPQYGFALHMYGSTFSGLCLKGGDLDLSLLSQFPVEIYVFPLIAKLLIENGYLEVKCIETAKVPVIKFRDPISKIHCDLSLNQVFGIFNSEYFLLATEINPLLVHVTLVLKFWLKQRDLNCPFNGTISSCTLVTLILYFFKQNDPPLFPLTCVHTLNKNMNPVFFSDSKKISLNVLSKFSIGWLVYNFFVFYSKFDFEQPVSLLPCDNIFIIPAVMTVLDPINLQNNLSCVVTHDGKQLFIDELKRARQILEETSNFGLVAEKK